MAATTIQVPTNGPKKRHSVSVGTVTADSVASLLIGCDESVNESKHVLLTAVNEQGSMSAVSMPHSNVVGCESLEPAVMTDKGVSVTAAIMAVISITSATRLTLCIILILYIMSLYVPTVRFTKAMPFLDKRFIDKEDC
ncbi:hypothetical protein Tco_0071678 [Tanacetum coccineum]